MGLWPFHTGITRRTPAPVSTPAPSRGRCTPLATSPSSGLLRNTAGGIPGPADLVQSNAYWCEHPRRGKVQFSVGELLATHGVVLVETLNPVRPGTDLPLHLEGAPISYFTVNDFCNILQELRTIPEIEAYLDARRALPLDALRLVDREHSLYEYYLLTAAVSAPRLLFAGPT